MPITPFHFGPGAAFHAVAPRHVSFIAFCAANVLIDVEPLYYMLTHQFPLHRFFHTYIGATVITTSTVALFLLMRALARVMPLPNVLGWKELTLVPVVIGAALGSYSHILLDSIMHSDIRPLSPISDANILFRLIGLGPLHMLCMMAGVVGLVVAVVREVRKGDDAR